MAEMIKFFKGAVASLPASGVNGAFYVTTDEGAIYLGTGTGMKRLGDFIQVDAVANLPTDGANVSALYYCVAENVLAKWNGSTWTQINKQRTAEEVKTLIGLADYETKADAAQKLVDAKAYTDTEVAEVEAYVGTIPEGYTETNVIAYINKKAEETLSSAQGGSSETAASVKQALDTYKAEVDLKIAALEEDSHEHTNKTVLDGITAEKVAAWDAAEGNAEAYAKEYADSLAKNYDTAGSAAAVQTALDEYEAANDGVIAAIKDGTTIDSFKDVETALAGKVDNGALDEAIAAAKKAGDDAQADVDALSDSVGEVAEGKTVVQMIADAQAAATYDDTQVKADIKANADAIAAIEGDYLTSADKDNLQTQIDTIMNNPDTEGVINSINEFTQYIADHGEIAEGFRTDIDANAEAIAANTQAIADQATADAAKYETKTDASAKLTEAKEYADGLNGAMDTRVKALEAIDHDAYKAADETTLASAKAYTDEKNTAMDTRVKALEAIDHEAYKAYADQAEADAIASAKEYSDGLAGNYDAKGSASQALTDAKAYADGLNTAMDARVDVLEAIDHDAYKAADETTLASAKSYADGLASNYDASGSAAQALVDAKAYADTAESDAVTSANAYTDSALTWGSF